MTREEAKKYFWTDTKEFGESVAKKYGRINYQKIFSGYYIGREIDEFIDKIYDDFEEELKKAYIEGGNDVWKALNCKELAK